MTSEDFEVDGSLPLPAVIVRVVIGAFISCENLTLLLVIFKSKLHTSKYLFTASLGVSDLFVGIALISLSPFYLPSLVSQYGSRSAAIRIQEVAILGMLLLSVIQMAGVALERYLYIAYPFFYERRLTFRNVKRIIAVFWCLGLVIFVVFGLFQVNAIETRTAHEISNGYVSIYINLIYASVYLISIVVTCVCYVLILVQVKKHRRAIATCSSGATRTIPKWGELAKSLKFFLTVFGVYFLMTFPSFVFESLRFIHPHWTNINVRYILVTFLLSNSGMNLLILTIIDGHFRSKVKTILYAYFGGLIE